MAVLLPEGSNMTRTAGRHPLRSSARQPVPQVHREHFELNAELKGMAFHPFLNTQIPMPSARHDRTKDAG